jgi:hypothetical protein
MDVDGYLTESASFTREVLTGKWSRWLVFILLGLPWTVLTSLLASRQVFDGTTIHWSLIPWNESAVLIIAGILCNLFLSGYIVRLLAGGDTPPEFVNWSHLALAGIKVHTLPLVWVLVPILLTLIQTAIAEGGFLYGGSPWQVPALLLVLLILLVQILILFFAVNYVIIGATRFARTGSIREGFAIPAIKTTLDHIGIVNYYIALGVITLVFLLVSVLLNILALIPLAGPLITLALGPLLTVFCIRFMAHFSDEDTQGIQPAEESVPLRAHIPELLAWLAILAVLMVLCFTPLVVVSGALGKILPS